MKYFCKCGQERSRGAIGCRQCAIVKQRIVGHSKNDATNNFRWRSSIRKNAWRVYLRSDKPKRCIRCGYDKHFEVCHIKAVSDFADDTPIDIINAIENLIALCPNCHWELDNGLWIYCGQVELVRTEAS